MSLITTISELKNYISVDVNTKFATLQPYINEAEQLYLIPIIGQEFYDEFAAAYAASVAPVTPVALTADEAALLPYLQRCVAYYSQMLSIVHLSSSFGDRGIRVHMDDKSMVAPRWQHEKLQFQALKNGDIHADKLLAFLEANATSSKYDTWFDSTYNTRKKGMLVYSTDIASRFIQISNSRRVYLKLYQSIKDIEQRVAKKLIGKEQYDELISALSANTVSTAQQDLLDKLYPIICKRALYTQLPFMRISINENGVFVYSGLDELHKYFATDADIKILRMQLIDGELGYLTDEEELQQFIKDNIADYPLIAASPAYTVQPDPGPTFKPNNDPNNKHFIA
jgi:hypothetical protein